MPYTTPKVTYSATYNGGFAQLSGVQSATVTRGRQYFQDNFSGSQCNVELIAADSYTLPLAVGQWLELRETTSQYSPCYFSGRITDVNRTYGMKYDSGTGAAPSDRIFITAVGATGMLGTTNGVSSTMGAIAAPVAMSAICTANSVSSVLYGTTGATVQAKTYINYKALDLINEMARTGQAFIDDFDTSRTQRQTAVIFANSGTGRVATFTDNGTTGDEVFKYNKIEYQSSVQTAFTQVAVTPTGLATQSAQTGSAPYASLNYQTLNSSTDDALNLATYLLSLNSQASITPFMITTDTNIQPSASIIPRLFNGVAYGYPIGSQVTVTFRGTTVYAQLQGITANFYPDYMSVRLTLSPSIGTPFTLNSTAFGVLDTNRLGFS